MVYHSAASTFLSAVEMSGKPVCDASVMRGVVSEIIYLSKNSAINYFLCGYSSRGIFAGEGYNEFYSVSVYSFLYALTFSRCDSQDLLCEDIHFCVCKSDHNVCVTIRGGTNDSAVRSACEKLLKACEGLDGELFTKRRELFGVFVISSDNVNEIVSVIIIVRRVYVPNSTHYNLFHSKYTGFPVLLDV